MDVTMKDSRQPKKPMKVAMKDLEVNIVDFVRRRDLLNDLTLSETQIACLKSVYGLPLNDREREIYFRGTGRATYEAKEQREATFITGRRGGKTGKLAAPIVFTKRFETTVSHQARMHT
jgi:hypothetical protein